MAKQNYKDGRTELRIEGVSEQLHGNLKNIAKNLGITISQFMRPKLKEIENSYPEDMKRPPREI